MQDFISNPNPKDIALHKLGTRNKLQLDIKNSQAI